MSESKKSGERSHEFFSDGTDAEKIQTDGTGVDVEHYAARIEGNRLESAARFQELVGDSQYTNLTDYDEAQLRALGYIE